MDSLNESERSAMEKGTGFKFSAEPSLLTLQEVQKKFAKDRNWDQYHSPRNILLALVGEVGELAEIFQWKGEVKEGVPEFTEDERTHLGQEMGDVLLYLIRLADKCHIDLPVATLNKVKLNEQKYPADKVYGKSHKYTEYEETDAGDSNKRQKLSNSTDNGTVDTSP